MDNLGIPAERLIAETNERILYADEIGYRPFTDEQIKLFAQCAEAAYANDLWWRDDLNEVARDLIIGSLSQQWDSPSAIAKQLKLIAKNPDRFFDRIDRDRVGVFNEPLAASLRHGTRWTDNQLLDAARHRDEFLRGVDNILKPR